VQAEGYLREGMAYCAERDLGGWGHCLRGHLARARLDQGDWSGAAEDAAAILRTPWAAGSNRSPALIALGYVRLRRGDPGAEAALDEARELALGSGELERIAPMAAARAEWRWLQGDRAGDVAEAAVGFQLALKHNYPWYLGEVTIWLWRGGGARARAEGTRARFSLQIDGGGRAE